jgi:PLP dependent protein
MMHPTPPGRERQICEAVHTRIMSSATPSLQSSVTAVNIRVRAAAIAAGRPPDSVRLIAVSKAQDVQAIASAHACGVTDFGENYLQEALSKIRALADLPLTWHFIGRLQANKTRDVAGHFQWVHTVDRPSIIRRLNDHTPATRLLEICLQLNVDGDPNKGGLAVEDQKAIEELVQLTQSCDRLRLRGLMTILDETTPPAVGYSRLAAAFDRLRPIAGEHWDTLSMGMSADFEAAIAAGATHVRIGQAVFGRRLSKTGE